MTVLDHLQRSSWKAGAIRRGQIKISGPIPILQHAPSNANLEEIGLTGKGSLDGSVRPIEAIEQHDQKPGTPTAPSAPLSKTPGQPSASPANLAEAHLPQVSVVPKHQASTFAPAKAQENETPSANVMAQTISFSPFVQTTVTATKAGQKKRRQSGLKNAFRKVFGRRSRGEGEVEKPVMLRKGSTYHYSAPEASSQPSQGQSQGPSEPFTSSLSATASSHPHPLGQHLPFPMNVNAPQASPPHDYITFDLRRSRRVTLPNSSGIKMRQRDLDPIRGRSSAGHGKQEQDSLLSPGIGVALSSPPRTATPDKTDRRSRSADALRDLAKDCHLLSKRNRSAEIRYWRASCEPGSLCDGSEIAETVQDTHVQESAMRGQDTEAASRNDALSIGADDQKMLEQLEVESGGRCDAGAPGSVFRFSNFGSVFTGRMRTSRSRDTLEAPVSPTQICDPPPIELRVRHLEEKCNDLESAVHRLSMRDNRYTVILDNAPRMLHRNSSTHSSRRRSDPSLPRDFIQQSNSNAAALGMAFPMLAKDGESLSLETLRQILRHEGEARKTLQTQVKTLEQHISNLHIHVSQLMTTGVIASPSYPTPSPDALIASTENRLLAFRAMSSESVEPRYTQDKDDVRASAISKFSYSETGSESAQEEIEIEQPSTQGSFDDFSSPDVWTTPKEGQFVGSGFFHSQGKKNRDNVTDLV